MDVPSFHITIMEKEEEAEIVKRLGFSKRRKRLERSLAGLPCTSDYESLKRPSDDRG